jgi:hypothetical protein
MKDQVWQKQEWENTEFKEDDWGQTNLDGKIFSNCKSTTPRQSRRGMS